MIRATIKPRQPSTQLLTIQRCRNILQEAQHEALVLIANARRRAARHLTIRRARAFKLGFDAGLQSGAKNIRSIMYELQELPKKHIEQLERHSIDLAYKLAEQIIGTELRRSPEIYAAWIREAISIMYSDRCLRLTCYPADISWLGEMLRTEKLTIELVADTVLKQGEIVLRGDRGSIEFAWREALRRSSMRAEDSE